MKIKDSVDLKELEKFGYKNILDDHCYKNIKGYTVVVYYYKEIALWNGVKKLSKNIKPYIKDLIQANLVEE